MELNKVLGKINKEREKTEAAWVFCLWSNPELYDSYMSVNEGNDKTLQDKDAIWYFDLGKNLYKQGFRNFDAITVDAFLADKNSTRETYEKFGGYHTISELKKLVNPHNVEGYFDKIARMNSLSTMAKKYEDIFEHVEKFENASNEDVFNTFDLLNTSVSIKTSNSAVIEDLVITKEFIDKCKRGESVGLSYSKGAPLLNYCTLGAPLGDVYMFAGHSGCGKSSFIFENMVIPFTNQGIGCAIISNEMRSDTYKILLLVHILTHDLGYYNLTRKKIKMGKISEEDEKMIEKAMKISEEKYSLIKFVKLFDNNTPEVIKFIKKFKSQGVQSIIWDTMKNDDSMDDNLWQQLLMNSRKVFNVVSKENLSLIVTFQLALYTTNQRFLDAGCLSNSKQVKEILSELVLMRRLWADEYTGQKYDCKPWRFNKENNKIKEFITLDPDKKYMVCFLDKTRNDEDKLTILYQWEGHYNKWSEIGYCNIVNDHRSYG